MANPADLKKSKIPVAQGFMRFFPRAMLAVAEVSKWGVHKHEVDLSDRTFLDPGRYPLEGYEDAIARHLLALELEGEVNEEDGGMLHRAQLAWNAMVMLEKYLYDQEE